MVDSPPDNELEKREQLQENQRVINLKNSIFKNENKNYSGSKEGI